MAWDRYFWFILVGKVKTLSFLKTLCQNIKFVIVARCGQIYVIFLSWSYKLKALVFVKDFSHMSISYAFKITLSRISQKSIIEAFSKIILYFLSHDYNYMIAIYLWNSTKTMNTLYHKLYFNLHWCYIHHFNPKSLLNCFNHIKIPIILIHFQLF